MPNKKSPARSKAHFLNSNLKSMHKGNENPQYTQSDVLKLRAGLAMAHVKDAIESCKTPEQLATADRLVSQFRLVFGSAPNYGVCNNELQCALQNSRIDIHYLQVPKVESYRRYLR